MFEIKDLLCLENVPERIELYDISNISGSDNVGVCVVYENGKPKKAITENLTFAPLSGRMIT